MMKKGLNKYGLLFLGFMSSQGSIFAQERLTPISENPMLQQTEKPSPKKSLSTSLPFFDDFTDNSPYPSTANWSDGNVFINNTYGKNPPSIGVATFDAIDDLGFIYPSLSENPSMADVLTSRVIDLSGAASNSVYLSFYYQPQGCGDAPEWNDSLLLQFITPDTVATVWFANGCAFETFQTDTLHAPVNGVDTLLFKLVHLKVNEEFLSSNFQFRFVNYASIHIDVSMRTNRDQWNIDYVYLNQDRTATDTIFRDLTMVTPPGSFLKNYSSVPWAHFKTAIDKELNGVYFHVRNNDANGRNLNEINLYIREEVSQWEDSYRVGQKNLDAFTNYSDLRWQFVEPPFVWQANEKALFTLTAELETDGVDQPQNNTAYRQVVCEKYYSYDDGTAEYAYNIDEDSRKAAYRYHTYEPDSLRGFFMYFLRNKDQVSALESFIPCIWSSEDGKPGTLIYKDGTAKKVAFGDSLNQFVPIWLDSAVFIEDDFFIGWEQEQGKSINLGFDANTNTSSKRFYYNGQWYESDYEGSLMLRPIFSKEKINTAIADTKIPGPAFQLFPNPSDGEFTLQSNDGTVQGELFIYNHVGILLDRTELQPENYNFSHLNQGLYFIRIETTDKKTQIIKWLKQ